MTLIPSYSLLMLPVRSQAVPSDVWYLFSNPKKKINRSVCVESLRMDQASDWAGLHIKTFKCIKTIPQLMWDVGVPGDQCDHLALLGCRPEHL